MVADLMLYGGLMKMNKDETWKGICPVCRNDVAVGYENDLYTVAKMSEHIGATLDCPHCNALLKLNDDLTCSDFGTELSEIYKGAGLNVSKEEAKSNYIEF